MIIDAFGGQYQPTYMYAGAQVWNWSGGPIGSDFFRGFLLCGTLTVEPLLIGELTVMPMLTGDSSIVVCQD